MANILEQIKAQVNQLPREAVIAELAKARAEKEKRTAKQKEYNSSPEAKAKRSEYNKARNQDPTVVAKRKEYHSRPEVKEKQKAYRKERNERVKALEARAAELGLDPKDPSSWPQTTGATA